MSIKVPISYICSDDSILPNGRYNLFGEIELKEDWHFSLSQRNRLTTIGCDVDSVFADHASNMAVRSCSASCIDEFGIGPTDGNCEGFGCCQVHVPTGIKRFPFFKIRIGRDRDNFTLHPCSFVHLVDQDQFQFHTSYLSNYSFYLDTNGTAPVVLDWAVSNKTCKSALLVEDCACRGQTTKCVDAKNGYICACQKGYAGDPYKGCSDIDECDDKTQHNCTHACENVPGSYRCTCPRGMHGNGRRDGSGCKHPVTQLVVGINLIVLILIIVATVFYLHLQRNKLEKLKAEYYYQNGGAIYNNLSSRAGVDIVKVYHEDELKKATNNYSEKIGEGGYGVVYKGFLADKGEVAVKKSKTMDKNQVEDFINEISVLYRMNHKNVVRLLGCCLEAKSPILVYEFISNGTLAHHLHHMNFIGSISFRNRLKIASETAGALAYLHSDVSVPIIHGDVKSLNILLDTSMNAKVSDFGTSRLVPSDHQGQIETIVKGTPGYLDPEYLQTCQLTDKSDVYSFGVVLVELLTGQIPLLRRGPDRKSSVRHFISEMKRNRLSNILEERVRIEGGEDELTIHARLAERCLSIKGDHRPTMRDVATELQQLTRSSTALPWERMNNEEKESLLRVSNWEDGSTSATGEVSTDRWVSLEMEMAVGR